MTRDEILTQIRQLPLDERRAILEDLSRDFNELSENQPGLPANLRGILKPDGSLPSDEELKRDYIDYLESKYS